MSNSKLPRVTARIFASNAAEGDIGQYGSARNGTKVLTSDIAQIQALPAYETGWRAAVLSSRNFPTLQEFNGMQKVFSQQIAYLLNNGTAEYDAGTNYFKGDIVKILTNGVPALKYSLTDNNIGNLTSDTNYWADFELADTSTLVNIDLSNLSATGEAHFANPSLSNLNATGNAVLANKTNIDLSNLSATGEAHFVNPSLNNLNSTGYAKLQYEPFTINNGSINSSGYNNTLTASGSILTCAPCTLTTANGKTITISNQITKNASDRSNGWYYVVVDTQGNSLGFLYNSYELVSKTPPVNPANWQIWLDVSKRPLELKAYVNGSWEVKDYIVYIGDMQVTNGVITSVSNNYFNACLAKRDLVKHYQNGNSFYSLYSDGWCVQGNYGSQLTKNASITFLLSYKDTNYILEGVGFTIENIGNQLVTKTTSGFTTSSDTANCSTNWWKASGFIW